MKLFDTFEAIKFPEEDMIFITRDGYLYYTYNLKYKNWRKYRNAGNDWLTVSNYPDVSRDELANAMGGVFPKKETDFMRLCRPEELWIRDMLDLLREDYPKYMSDYPVRHVIHRLLLESDIRVKSYGRIREALDVAAANYSDNNRVVDQIKAISLEIIGRDIFKKEIGIVDGHKGSSNFRIMPVRVIDYADTDNINNVAEMRSVEISIEEDDVAQYLTPFLFKHFDDELKANKQRDVIGFEWNLTHNYFTYDSVAAILSDIRDMVDVLVAEHNTNQPTGDDIEAELVLDFYRRFIYRMEYMVNVGKEKGYDLISFKGP